MYGELLSEVRVEESGQFTFEFEEATIVADIHLHENSYYQGDSDGRPGETIYECDYDICDIVCVYDEHGNDLPFDFKAVSELVYDNIS